MRINKDQGWPALIGGLAALIPLMLFTWTVVKPAISAAFADEIKATVQNEIKATVQSEVSPIRGGLSVIIQSNIVKLKKEIAQLERLRAADPSKWTAEQADSLVDKQNELEAQQMALATLR